MIEGKDLAVRAFDLAIEYHKDQVDKAGRPYMEHLTRVGIRAATKGRTFDECFLLMAIGFLHDILEDTELTYEELESHIQNKTVVDTVLLLTRTKGQVYFEYIDIISHDIRAITVKLADLYDHLFTNNGFILPDSLKDRYEKAEYQLMNSSEFLKHSSGTSS